MSEYTSDVYGGFTWSEKPVYLFDRIINHIYQQTWAVEGD